MNINDLMAAGGFVSEVPVKKTVTWKRKDEAGKDIESTFEMYVRKQSFGAVEAIYGSEKDRAKMSKYISESICDGEGNEVIPYDKAMQLDPGLGTLFVKAINEVNGLGRTEPKN